MLDAIGSFAMTVDKAGVALLVFSRPPVNAVSLSVYEDLGRLVKVIAANPAIRSVVLTAPDDAPAWCGGADLKEFVGMDTPHRKERYRFINEQLPHFYTLDRPVIAAINRATIGIGMVLAGLCDMRVAAEDAPFAVPEIDYGLVGGGAGLFGMLKMPEAKVRELLFTGRSMSGEEAERWGFLNRLCAPEGLLTEAQALATELASGPTFAHGMTKKMLHQEWNMGIDEAIESEAQAQAICMATKDFHRAYEAFVGKQKPVFKGD